MIISIIFAILSGGFFSLGILHNKPKFLAFSALFGFLTLSCQIDLVGDKIIEEIKTAQKK